MKVVAYGSVRTVKQMEKPIHPSLREKIPLKTI